MPTLPVNKPATHEVPLLQSIVSVLWPSFLVATVGTVVFFALFNPVELAGILGFPELSALAGYTAGFFGFWLLSSISSSLTCYFRKPSFRPHSKGRNNIEQ